MYVDFRDTTVDIVGEILRPITTGAITRDDVLGDLHDLLSADEAVRRITAYLLGSAH